MKRIGTLTCCSRRGDRRVLQVFVEVETDPPAWYFTLVALDPPDPTEEKYVARVFAVDEHVAQVALTSNQLPEDYQGCGISRALFPRVATLLGCSLRSSLNPEATEVRRTASGGTVERVDETLSVGALKVWERLCQDCMAHYNGNDGRFYCKPDQAIFVST